MGLKAKPTKPVTEVLRPVVAKYGLDLGSLLVRLVSVIWSCPFIPQSHIPFHVTVLPRLGQRPPLPPVFSLSFICTVFIIGEVDICFR